ncbi:tRNA dihydrouridine synthase DusB [Sulfuriroseicoccus oceanibius]|uniref:tRNA-dihydrouridine synthase n=1 Tax=Sulfuriroseicoccus oceanibius TaxID=2707525 RepID=A0A6B3LBR5_9BACT|nr:tRNA dihydrouridine synthase DusB [Sulfuriroseicoccus oceanibius]QQL44577.1 tRNA dihydrouridine synthase DusB [Sulfuriroseicoccus oceanibius]
MLHWLQDKSAFPLYLAPMAGVTDYVFRQICHELGADVMVTEFVSAEGIIQQDERTRRYTEFPDEQRPVGVQLFGANPENLAKAAQKVVAWKRPDFIDINFGCPVNKVVSRNGGSSLLRDCPLLGSVAEAIVKAVDVPVTAKIRVGWDQQSINAVEVCKLLENVGVQAVAIHGRTRSQGYTGEANWDIIGECADNVNIPVIGNGDIATGADVQKRKTETNVAGVMIGRAAMQYPWVFRDAKHFLKTGELPEPASVQERWELMRRHATLAIERGHKGNERQTLTGMRSRLMAYSKGLPGGRTLRTQFSQVSSISELEDIAATHMASLDDLPEHQRSLSHPQISGKGI